MYREEGRGKGEVKEGVEVCVRKQRVSLIDFRERDKPTLCFVLFCFISLCFLTKEEETGWLCVRFYIGVFIYYYFYFYYFKKIQYYFIYFYVFVMFSYIILWKRRKKIKALSLKL